jgi:hypothetical protein
LEALVGEGKNEVDRLDQDPNQIRPQADHFVGEYPEFVLILKTSHDMLCHLTHDPRGNIRHDKHTRLSAERFSAQKIDRMRERKLAR